MDELTIKTDYKWKNLLYSYEVPQKVLRTDFDWLDEHNDGFVRYYGRYYHVSEFMDLHNEIHMPHNPFPKQWDGYHADSFFSGILIEISDCGEMYRIGTYFS